MNPMPKKTAKPKSDEQTVIVPVDPAVARRDFLRASEHAVKAANAVKTCREDVKRLDALLAETFAGHGAGSEQFERVAVDAAKANMALEDARDGLKAAKKEQATAYATWNSVPKEERRAVVAA